MRTQPEPVAPSGAPAHGAGCQPDSIDDSDPRPRPPEKPLPSDCCGSGCECCVVDVCADELDDYRERLGAWQQRLPRTDDAGARSPPKSRIG